MTRRILISGASIAGPVTAYWLAKSGFDVTIVERAPSLRLGGQNIDITDAARDVIRMMGLEEKIRAHHTGEKGLQFVNSADKARANFPVKARGSMTREIEILRGDLAQLLVDETADNVTYRFADSIEALEDTGDEVHVTFESGLLETFDIVIAADGMNSSTRKLIIGDDNSDEYIGCWSSYFTIPRTAKDNDWWRWYTSPTGVVAFLRPDNQGTMRASVNFLSEDSEARRMSLDEKRQIIRKRLSGAGWESERIAAALDDVDDIFLGPLSQIKAGTWHNGRMALVGDAAHCPTPYTGMGTTLAILGSYILAQELASHEKHEDAFRAYEAKFRPFVEQAQKLPPGVPSAAYARSKLKASLINTGAAIAASKPVQTLISIFSRGAKDENKFALPDYMSNWSSQLGA
ncbi:MAG: FAD-dependent monooxygenase [Pseudomonadota bacterium]